MRRGYCWEKLNSSAYRWELRREKSQKNITGPVSVIYWLAVTAVFLIYTFGPNGNGQPRYSWIIWAVAGVLYAAVLAGIKLIRNRK